MGQGRDLKLLRNLLILHLFSLPARSLHQESGDCLKPDHEIRPDTDRVAWGKFLECLIFEAFADFCLMQEGEIIDESDCRSCYFYSIVG